MQIAARTNRYDPVAAEFTRSRVRAHRAAAADQAGTNRGSPYGILAIVPRQATNEAAPESRTVPALALSSNLALLDINALLEGGAVQPATATRPSTSSPLPAPADAPDSIDELLSRMLTVG